MSLTATKSLTQDIVFKWVEQAMVEFVEGNQKCLNHEDGPDFDFDYLNKPSYSLATHNQLALFASKLIKKLAETDYDIIPTCLFNEFLVTVEVYCNISSFSFKERVALFDFQLCGGPYIMSAHLGVYQTK